MRKKSHISLARYIINNMQVEDLHNHKKAFYFGSILPDLKPSFLTKRHTIEETFEDLITEIRRVTVDYDINRGINGYYARHLGVITHYLSDYCTFPHNSIFKGNIKEHVYYEKDLKCSMKEYFNRDDIQRNRDNIQKFNTIDDILHFIKKTHKEYLKALKVVHEDIQYIIDLCYKVVDAILMFFEIALEKFEKELVNKHNSLVTYQHI